MSLTAAEGGFVLFLLCVPVAGSLSGFSVSCSPARICAEKGSTVDITCSYTHPSEVNGNAVTVQKTFWFTQGLVDLTTRAAYEGRVKNSCDGNSCTLRITDLRDRDSADYKFRFMTNLQDGSYSSPTGVTLSVTGYRYQNCARVTYSDRSICAFRGSSVDISCTYHSYGYITSKFWFSPGQSHQQLDSSELKDIEEDSQYAGRVQVFGHGGSSTLRITDLRETDSAEYRFKFITSRYEWGSSLPGTTLTVTALQVHVTRISVYQHYTQLQLKCLSSCTLSGQRYVWYENGQEGYMGTSSYRTWVTLEDKISCALKTHEQSRAPEVYAPKPPSVSVSPSAEIVEGSSVTLNCSSDANPAASYTWYKKDKNQGLESLCEEPQLVFSSIQASDSGAYYCTAENALGKRTSGHIGIDVRYAPRLPSVSVSPSAEIVEESSVTLSCSSDANPAANYTWYKENQTLLEAPKGIYSFTSIRSEDRGLYYCRSENMYGHNISTSTLIDVQYAPRLPSVSVSPSADIVEGSSVNLTCSSDANPAANYTWYKENEDSPKASGQIFTIPEVTPEHSGNYYCEAQNSRGHHNSSVHGIAVSGSLKSAAVGSIVFIFLAVVLLSAFLLIRRKRSSKKTSRESRENPDDTAQQSAGPRHDNPSTAAKREAAEQQDNLYYATVHFRRKQEDPLYSNVMLAQPNKHEEEDEEDDVEYTVISFSDGDPGPRRQEAVENSSALYSTVNKKLRP